MAKIKPFCKEKYRTAVIILVFADFLHIYPATVSPLSALIQSCASKRVCLGRRYGCVRAGGACVEIGVGCRFQGWRGDVVLYNAFYDRNEKASSKDIRCGSSAHSGAGSRMAQACGEKAGASAWVRGCRRRFGCAGRVVRDDSRHPARVVGGYMGALRRWSRTRFAR